MAEPSAELRLTDPGTSCADFSRFLRAWVTNPLRVAAVAPSSGALARVMTHEISPALGPVLELGPGTGVFTRALLARGIAESDLTLIEFSADFARMLESRFPRARILSMDAARLARHELYEGSPVGAVVSGLPLLSMPPDKVADIVAGAFHYLRPDGAFYQFTYGPRCPVPRAILSGLGLQAARIGGTFWNLPPAAVYRISRVRQSG
ncbi:methyltransferase domain-containing protein [Labrys sp. LIt4]|uniref:class I SAM-dependent methyltransferase n=1 Tax=Labrys sp. LIt4 TaxID=2821355 RepID=UPI001ADF3DC0|nr:methyltransferase domain-containing protein [Labrys sp. LIt4]MBP0579654.1 methyltransferase domain-containing protein [Labrys sp. LIt4]